MEAFEHVVKVALEAQNYVVTSNIKFPVEKMTKTGPQTHGYEVDIVGARHSSLILGSVKSFLGSPGVNRQGFDGIATRDKDKNGDLSAYKLFNDKPLRKAVFKKAREKYGYPLEQIQLTLYVGHFTRGHEAMIREHLGKTVEGAGPIKVVGLNEIVQELIKAARSKTYVNDPVIMTLKSLEQSGHLVGEPLSESGQTVNAGSLVSHTTPLVERCHPERSEGSGESGVKSPPQISHPPPAGSERHFRSNEIHRFHLETPLGRTRTG